MPGDPDWCERCLIPLSMCEHGREPDWAGLWAVSQSWHDGLGRWRESQYDGRCRGCGSSFEAGELIRYSDDEGGWLAECCGVSAAELTDLDVL